MGDRTVPPSDTALTIDQVPERRTGVSHRSGFGRAYFLWPSTRVLKPTSGWEWRRFYVLPNEKVSYSVGAGDGVLSADVTHYKWAMFWLEPDFESVADVRIQLVDRCTVNGTRILAADGSPNLRKGMDLLLPDVRDTIGEPCLFMEVIAHRVPSGGRLVYSADFYHSDTDLVPF